MLHGGGSSEASEDHKADNNGFWHSMSTGTYYRTSVAAKVEADRAKGIEVGAMYIAARGLTTPGMGDTWDLHCMPNSFALYTKLLRQLIRPNPFSTEDLGRLKDASTAKDSKYTLSSQPLNFVDPNQVYITGFSAGGDGVYRLATSLADHFAAANMSAGHPGGVRFENLANLPFSFQVGALDVSWWRSFMACGKYLLLRKWSQQLAGRYVASCSLHKTLPFDPDYPDSDKDDEIHRAHEKNGYEYRHNHWEEAEGSGNFAKKSDVFKQSGEILQHWFDKVKQCEVKPNWNANPNASDGQYKKMEKERSQVISFYNDPSKVPQDGSVLEKVNTNAIKWCGEVSDPAPANKTKARLRDPNPDTIIWELGSRNPIPDKLITTWTEQKFFYWLYIRDDMTADYKPYKAFLDMDKGKTNHLVIRADRKGNTVFVNQPYNFLGILLSEHMFDFSKPIQVVIPSSRTNVTTMLESENVPTGPNPNTDVKLGQVTVEAVRKIKEETLQARGDLNYMFSAALWFQKQGEKWVVNIADTLFPNGASPFTASAQPPTKS